jgi:DNA (cytosine-5)-methyltransferase 1
MKPRLLDLYCCAGGATCGYQRAGFYVVGVDIAPQPHYIGDEFVQSDALAYLREHGHEFDAIHASPPCQEYTKAAQQWRTFGKEYPDMVGQTREALKAAGKPYVIENVPGAPLVNPVILNGAMFGLLVHRVRLFECSFEVPFFLLPQLKRPVKMGRAVVEGDVIQPVGHFSGADYARRQMGIDWMNKAELAQAIPPVYCEYIGKQLLNVLQVTL